MPYPYPACKNPQHQAFSPVQKTYIVTKRKLKGNPKETVSMPVGNPNVVGIDAGNRSHPAWVAQDNVKELPTHRWAT